MGERTCCSNSGALLVAMLSVLLQNAAHAASEKPAPSATCAQLGGTLPCKLAEGSAWTYHAFNKQFLDEATVYNYMMERYGPKAFFRIAYRWNQAPQQEWRTEFDHSIESASWKIYDICVPGMPIGFCDQNPNFRGYRRVRTVNCPTGYQFGTDQKSPYCNENRSLTQANSN